MAIKENILHQKLVLDVNSTDSLNVIEMKQGDKSSRYVDITLVASGEPIDIKKLVGENGKAKIIASMKGELRQNDIAEINNTDNTVVVELSQNALSEAGNLDCEIRLIDSNDSVLSSALFIVRVGRSAAGENAKVVNVLEGIVKTEHYDDKSVTPSKLDRAYWERKTSINTQIKSADDLFDVTGFVGFGGSIAFLNVDLTVNIGKDVVELVDINGFCYAVGVKFTDRETVYLINVTDGTQWKITRYNEGDDVVLIYRLECSRLDSEEIKAIIPRIEFLENNAKFTFMGMINGLSELRAYTFAEDRVYHLYAAAEVGGLIGSGYCYARYYTDASNYKMLEVFNSSTLKVWELNVTLGTAELKSGGLVTPEGLDRKYWEYSKSSFVGTAHGLLDMLTEETKVMRIKALKDSSMYYWLGDDDALALKTNEGMLVINLCNGKTYKFDPEGGGLAEIDKINDGDINREYLFSEDMREMFLSLPVLKATAEDFTVEWFNSKTTPGIYQAKSNSGEHCVLIVLKPDTQIHLMQIKLSHGKLEYRSCLSDLPQHYFANCWTEWVDLTAGGTNSIVDAGVFDAASELQDYPFADERWYSFQLEGALGSGICLGKFSADIEESIPNYVSNPSIRFINLSKGKCGRLYINTGEISYVEANLIASSIEVEDTDNNFSAENVEAVLVELFNKITATGGIELVSNPTNLGTQCGGLLSKITGNKCLSGSSTVWSDLPEGAGCGVVSLDYAPNYALQLAVSTRSPVMWARIIKTSTGTPYNDWFCITDHSVTRVLAVGDSICYGARNDNKGFVGDLGVTYKNAGKSGATISNAVTSATNIPDQLVGVTGFSPDIIIANGGINDYCDSVPLGSLSVVPVSTDEEAETLDRSTVMGGLEYLFYKMITLYPAAQRFFLITHKTYRAASGHYYPTHKNEAGYTQQDLHDKIVECCNAYNVKVIDVYKDSMINTLFSQYRSEVAYSTDSSVTDTEYVDSDGVHPLAYGYKQGYLPLIRKAIGIGTPKR